MRWALIGMLAVALPCAVRASPVVEERSFVVVQPAPKKPPSRECNLQGRIFFSGRQQVPKGTVLTGAYAQLSEGRELVVSDTMIVNAEVESSGVFKLKMSRKLPIALVAQAPGFEPAFVVVSTCDVSLDFVLGLKRDGSVP